MPMLYLVSQFLVISQVVNCLRDKFLAHDTSIQHIHTHVHMHTHTKHVYLLYITLHKGSKDYAIQNRGRMKN